MSQRSVSRAHRRRLEAAARRDARLRRTGLTAGAVLGAVAVAAPAAQAETFVVTSTDDSALVWERESRVDVTTLREAIMAANATAGPDTITFASGVTGTIRLTGGALEVDPGGLTITGPGRDVLTISGDADGDGEYSPGDTRILDVTTGAALELSGITATRGLGQTDESSQKYAGAITVFPGATLNFHDAAVTQSGKSTVGFPQGPEDISFGGAILNAGATTVARSAFSGNGSFLGGAITHLPTEQGDVQSSLAISDSSFTGNAALAGGAVSTKYGGLSGDLDSPVSITNSVFTQNTAVVGGAIAATPGTAASPLVVTGTTFDRNRAEQGGALALQNQADEAAAAATLDGNTFEGNVATQDGGAVVVGANAQDEIAFTRSTFTGNDARRGGAIAVQPGSGLVPVRGGRAAAPTTTGIVLDSLTVVGNTAGTSGGGIYLAPDEQEREVDGDTITETVPGSQVLSNSIVAGNALVERADVDTRARAVGDRTPDDLGQEPTDAPGDGFVLRHSLVQAPITAPNTTDPGAPSLLGVDPKLGALGANGGGTRTFLPADDSPVLDAGRSPAGVTTDQRGATRPADRDVANAVGGDGSDIGAVEVGLPAVPPPPTPQPPVPAPPAPPAQVVAPPAGTTAVGLPAPISRPGALTSGKLRQPITLRGTAGRGTSKVRVSVARKVGKKCRFLTSTGKFSALRDCRRTLYVTAQGTTSWRLKLPVLAKGRYTVWSRAIVGGKLVEKKKTAQNFRRFEIR